MNTTEPFKAAGNSNPREFIRGVGPKTPRRRHAHRPQDTQTFACVFQLWTLADIHWIIEFCVFFTKVTIGLL